MIGNVLEGKYEIERLIGRGGFAEVYRGHDLSLKRRVAVKILSRPDSEGFQVAHFHREAEAMARLQHPNIVTVYAFGEHDGRHYLVMELVEGVSLQELVRGSPLSSAEIVRIGLQVSNGMAYAHGHGLVHRDLTLKNILVGQDEREQLLVKILDFGLVKALHDSFRTASQAFMGTPAYMAPEQIRGEMVDRRADIFSFGVCLYRLANGRFPFEAEHPAALLYLIVNEETLHFETAVPVELCDIIRRCLQKDPRSRYSSFGELEADLLVLQSDDADGDSTLPVSAPTYSSLIDRSSKRNPYLNRVMIENPTDFIGREKEVRRIYSRLDAPHPQSISVVGSRRIGKSSLLNFIYNRRNRRRHMRNHENAIFAYLDFQSDADFDVPRFINFLLSTFGFETGEGSGYRTRKSSLDELQTAVKELQDRGKRIVILMDEFERITRNDKFDASFFSFLRSLANRYKVAYVTSSGAELQQMCHARDIADSPFFNIFSNLPLRPFSREEALELITRPSQTEGLPLGEHAEAILTLGGHFPLYLQMACSATFEHLIAQPDSVPDWGRVQEAFLDEACPHFEFTWERLEEQERENLRRVAYGRRIGRKFAYVSEGLERKGYLQRHDEGWRLFSEPFQVFVLRQTDRRSYASHWLARLFRKPRAC
jgi:serine/threonine protein kinase